MAKGGGGGTLSGFAAGATAVGQGIGGFIGGIGTGVGQAIGGIGSGITGTIGGLTGESPWALLAMGAIAYLLFARVPPAPAPGTASAPLPATRPIPRQTGAQSAAIGG